MITNHITMQRSSLAFSCFSCALQKTFQPFLFQKIDCYPSINLLPRYCLYSHAASIHSRKLGFERSVYKIDWARPTRNEMTLKNLEDLLKPLRIYFLVMLRRKQLCNYFTNFYDCIVLSQRPLSVPRSPPCTQRLQINIREKIFSTNKLQ